MSTDVVNKLWGFCHTLRHDGIDYGDYIEQLTYLLFIKMADERSVDLPEHTDWPYLRKQSGTDLLDSYVETLRILGKQQGMLGDIFAGSQSRFTNPVNLHKLIGLIDETEWTAIDTDIKAAAFEGLLEKAASEGKKGAGQYFTPRILIQSMVRCIKPDPRASKDFTIMDPACGTGGFLIAAYEWLKEQTTGGALDRDTAKRIRTGTYYGQELVARPRRLALMNLYLHQVEPHIALGDSIYEVPSNRRFDVILTNPPFGTKGANETPHREDFVVETSNKQLNFLQHVLTILKPGGRAAVIVPDNVLFAPQAAEIFKVLMEDCDLHTVLRCPRGTFSPYTEGTKTNVIFFTKGRPTSRTWIYDARSNVAKINKKSRPLSHAHFDDFERCFGSDPNGHSARKDSDSATGRWRSFSVDAIKAVSYKLDSFRWLGESGGDDGDALDIADVADLVSTTESALHESLHSFVKEITRSSALGLDTASSWPQYRLGDLLSDIQTGFASGRHNSEGSGTPHLRPMNITTEGRIDLTTVKYVDAGLVDRPSKWLAAGDVLFNNTNTPELVGKTALFTDSDQPAFSNHMTRIRVRTDLVRPGYVAICLHQGWREGWFESHCNNHVSQASISRAVLQEFPMLVPPLETQDELVELVGGLQRLTTLAMSSMEDLRATLRAATRTLLSTTQIDGGS